MWERRQGEAQGNLYTLSGGRIKAAPQNSRHSTSGITPARPQRIFKVNVPTCMFHHYLLYIEKLPDRVVQHEYHQY